MNWTTVSIRLCHPYEYSNIPRSTMSWLLKWDSKAGSTKKPKERYRYKRGPLNTCGPTKCINEGRRKGKDRSTRASSECSETTSSRSVAKISILRLRLSWGVDTRGCQLLWRRGVVPWWRRESYAPNPYLVSLHDRLLNFFVEISILFISYSCHLILAFLFKLYRLGASLDGSFVVVVSPPSFSCVPPW